MSQGERSREDYEGSDEQALLIVDLAGRVNVAGCPKLENTGKSSGRN
jgi:hypothetical protein